MSVVWKRRLKSSVWISLKPKCEKTLNGTGWVLESGGSRFKGETNCELVVARKIDLEPVWSDVGQNIAKFYQKWPKSSPGAVFTLEVWFSKGPKKVVKYLGYFGEKICHKDLSKIAQSGHSVWNDEQED